MLSLLPLVSEAYQGLWQRTEPKMVASQGTQTIVPGEYLVYSLKGGAMKNFLFSLGETAEEGQILELPAPDGNMRSYKVWQSSMMEAPLAAKYPGIRTFTGVDLSDPRITVKIDYTDFGFHAMTFDGAHTYMIDPYNDLKDGYYICYFKKNYSRPSGSAMSCEVDASSVPTAGTEMQLTRNGIPDLKFRVNGSTRKNYRLALACTGQYAVAVAGPSPTKAAVLSKMVTSINRVNGVYERELAVHMDLVADEDTIIFLNSTTDPYANTSSDMTANQNTITTRIGSANFDIGHLFGTGGGGVAFKGCVCQTSSKARGLTGSSNPIGDAFDIDYVAHEMGHQFGADHTFNANTGSCGGNGNSTTAFEPGSGSTIMAYAGICGSSNDIQQHSDDYFHATSLIEITDYITTDDGATCPTLMVIPNVPPVVAPFTQSYNIPFKTPFELTAPEAVDVDHDTLTYCWEQWNRGNFQQSWANVRTRGPIFRSFEPVTSRTRVFPTLDKLLAGVTSYVGEKLPDTSRYLTFKLTVRDVLNGAGTFNLPDDTIHLEVTDDAGPFIVTSPSTVVNWTGGTTQTITWDVANTTLPPVSCANVDILLSVDGGYTYPHTLATATANDGSEAVTIPNMNTTNQARIKVKGSGNVFFNVSASSFTITKDPSGVADIPWKEAVKIYPVPATDMLNVVNSQRKPLTVTVTNAVGQQLWKSELDKYLNIPVGNWAKGVYYIQLMESVSGERIVKPVVLQ